MLYATSWHGTRSIDDLATERTELQKIWNISLEVPDEVLVSFRMQDQEALSSRAIRSPKWVFDSSQRCFHGGGFHGSPWAIVFARTKRVT